MSLSRRIFKTFALPALLAGALATPALAATTSAVAGATANPAAPAAAQPEKPKAKKKKVGKITYDRGSAETTAERDRRLKRECKGRPNAGACLGYAY